MEVSKNTFCALCGKTAVSANNRPKSLHKTKRLMRPNLQKWNGLYICSRCRRTLKAAGLNSKTARVPAAATSTPAKSA
ncbi:MAG TPA: bL28 family ribosomal protein [Candidatus Saccharimonadales bacterium]|nr:bL28 family ribosomal protein [Candidatus Saccharimonadales bacterium]